MAESRCAASRRRWPIAWVFVGASAAAFPMVCGAQPIAELTLTCRDQRAYDFVKRETNPSADVFSVIVRMENGPGGSRLATMTATTPGCSEYFGTFSDLEVKGTCKRNIDKFNISSYLTINRVSGTFDDLVNVGASVVEYSGTCEVRKKMF